MDRIKSLFRPVQSYEPLGESVGSLEAREDDRAEGQLKTRFSWVEYTVFFILGIAMLWAW